MEVKEILTFSRLLQITETFPAACWRSRKSTQQQQQELSQKIREIVKK